MKFQLNWQRGQAMIIIVFAMIGLVAITGLAVDGSLAFSDRRHAQNAADTAAMAGAIAKIKNIDPYWDMTAKNRALDNGYDDDQVTNTVDVYTCYHVNASCAAPYTDDPDYIQVIITSHVDTFFARVIGITQMHNRVQAIALADEEYIGSLFGGHAIVELKPFTSGNCSNGTGEFIVGGSGEVNIYGGGVLINSNSSCAFQQNGCQTELHLYDGGEIDLVGEATLQGSCSNMMPPTPWGEAEPIAWPPTDYELPEPPECGQTPATPTYDGIDTTTLYPGHYNILPPNGLSGSTVHMAPGNYCVTSVLKAVGASTALEGTDVFIYVEPGGNFDLRGGDVTLVANTTDDTSIYKGYLIYVAPDPAYSDFSVSPTSCNINGGAVSQLTGAILAPYCDITISGSSASTGIISQIIGYTINLSGDNILNFYYDADLNPIVNWPAEMGLMR